MPPAGPRQWRPARWAPVPVTDPRRAYPPAAWGPGPVGTGRRRRRMHMAGWLRASDGRVPGADRSIPNGYLLLPDSTLAGSVSRMPQCGPCRPTTPPTTASTTLSPASAASTGPGTRSWGSSSDCLRGCATRGPVGLTVEELAKRTGTVRRARRAMGVGRGGPRPGGARREPPGGRPRHRGDPARPGPAGVPRWPVPPRGHRQPRLRATCPASSGRGWPAQAGPTGTARPSSASPSRTSRSSSRRSCQPTRSWSWTSGPGRGSWISTAVGAAG